MKACDSMTARKKFFELRLNVCLRHRHFKESSVFLVTYLLSFLFSKLHFEHYLFLHVFSVPLRFRSNKGNVNRNCCKGNNNSRSSKVIQTIIIESLSTVIMDQIILTIDRNVYRIFWINN